MCLCKNIFLQLVICTVYIYLLNNKSCGVISRHSLLGQKVWWVQGGVQIGMSRPKFKVDVS